MLWDRFTESYFFSSIKNKPFLFLDFGSIYDSLSISFIDSKFDYPDFLPAFSGFSSLWLPFLNFGLTVSVYCFFSVFFGRLMLSYFKMSSNSSSLISLYFCSIYFISILRFSSSKSISFSWGYGLTFGFSSLETSSVEGFSSFFRLSVGSTVV